MPLSTILISAAGTCLFCNQKARILSCEHPNAAGPTKPAGRRWSSSHPPVAMTGEVLFVHREAIPGVSGQRVALLGSVESGKARSCQPSAALGKRKSPAHSSRALRKRELSMALRYWTTGAA